MVVAGCASGSSAPSSVPPRDTTAASLGHGCGRAPDPASTATAPFGDVVQTLDVDGTARTYRLAVPAGYRRDHPTPLLFDFHGSESNAVQQSAYTQLPAQGAAAGYLVVTPDAVAGTWDLAPPGSPTADQRYLSALESDLGARYCVDARRIDAAGISLGSEFAAIPACDPANHIAAIGLVAAEFLLRPCSGPVSVLAFHGTADPIVAYAEGGVGRALPGVKVTGAVQNLAQWARLDRCGPDPVVATATPGLETRTWTGCATGTSVVLHSLVGGGHTWPGSPVVLSAAAFGPSTHVVNATHSMLGFFAAHPLARR